MLCEQMLEALPARGGEEGGWECVRGRQGSRGLGSWQRPQPPPPPPLARSLAGSTPDWLHQTHSWWSSPRCRVIPLPPFRTSTGRLMFPICGSRTFGFARVVPLSFAPASWLDRTLAFFVLMWGRIQGGLCFPDKANRSGQMLRRGWATRNGCHWSKSVDRGSLLEQFYVVLMRKHPLVPRFIGCIYQLLRR